jgi:DNA-binding PadR family transcriptional regulator
MTGEELVKQLAALIWMDKYGITGRYRLGKALDLTEGVTRGLLRKMSDDDLIKTEGKGGFSITSKGREVLKRELEKFKIVDIKEIDVGTLKTSAESMVIHLRGLGFNVRNGVEQRDAAIRAGAEGATTMIFRKNRLFLPYDGRNVESLPETVSSKLTDNFKLRNLDVVIIGFAGDKSKALQGALAASILTSEISASRIAFKERAPDGKEKREYEYAKLSSRQLREVQKLEKRYKIRLVGYR